MNADIYSLSCYIGALILTMTFAHLYEKGKKQNLYIILSYLTTICFCGFRFFVGNDYYGYYHLFHVLKNGMSWQYVCEPSFALLNYIFGFSTIGYFYVLFLSTIITYFFIFRTLKDLGILKWGVFCVYTLCFLIIANDQVRQGIAISIFFFSIRYIERGEFMKYLLTILIATSFHYSAFITIFAYYFRNIHIKPTIAFTLLVFVFIIKTSGIAEDILHSLSAFVSYYNESYGRKALDARYFSGATFGIQLLYFFIVSSIALLFSYKHSRKIYYNIFVFGACLYMLFWGQMLFERMSLYFFQVIILVLPNLFFKRTISSIAVFCICSTYFILQSLYALEKNGAVPYRTIYKENMVNPPYDKSTQTK